MGKYSSNHSPFRAIGPVGHVACCLAGWSFKNMGGEPAWLLHGLCGASVDGLHQGFEDASLNSVQCISQEHVCLWRLWFFFASRVPWKMVHISLLASLAPAARTICLSFEL